MHKHEHRDRYSSFVTVALKILVLLLVLAGAGFAASEPKYFGWISFLLALLSCGFIRPTMYGLAQSQKICWMK